MFLFQVPDVELIGDPDEEDLFTADHIQSTNQNQQETQRLIAGEN